MMFNRQQEDFRSLGLNHAFKGAFGRRSPKDEDEEEPAAPSAPSAPATAMPTNSEEPRHVALKVISCQEIELNVEDIEEAPIPEEAHAILYHHIISYHIISYHIISYRIISYHIILSRSASFFASDRCRSLAAGCPTCEPTFRRLNVGARSHKWMKPDLSLDPCATCAGG